MRLTSPQRFHSLLIAPLLLPLLFFGGSNSLNDPPALIDTNYSTHGTLFGSFPFNQPVRIVSTGQVSHGELRVFGPFNGFSQDSFIYLPGDGYVGSDSFTYHACDSTGNCVDGTIDIDVVNNAPHAVDDRYAVHGTLFGGGGSPLTVNDSDPDGDPIRVVSVTSAAHGTFNYVFSTDSFIYSPNQGFTGTDTATYKLCDNLGLCATGTVIFNVVNQAPLAQADNYTIQVNQSLSADGPEALLANDSDPDGDPFNISSYTQPASGTLTRSTTEGFFTYHPAPDFVGEDSFHYTNCDFLGACTTGTATIRVEGSTPTPTPTPTPVPTPGPDRDFGGGSCNEFVGEPVNVTTGDVYLTQSDYELPGIGAAISVTRSYNSQSQVVGIFGRGWSTMYDESIQVVGPNFIRYSAPDGRATYFSRSDSNAVFAPIEQDFHGQIAQSGNGSLILTMKDGSSSQFNSSGRLVSLADRMGNQSTLLYDGNGQLSSITDSFGRLLTVTSNSNGQGLSISDTLGTVATYAYGGSNELLSVTYPDNSAFNFTYDASLRLTTVTDALGHVVESHSYNDQGRALTSEKQGGVEHYSLNYVSATETDVTDGLGRMTKYTFDTSKGRNIVTQVEGLCNCGGGSGSQIQTWTYDDQLNVTSKTDALGHITSYTYDANGNRLTETDPTGTINYTYNGFGEVLTRTDQLNGLTTNTYDSQGNLLTTTNALDKTTTFTYDAHGLVQTVTDARGKVTAFAYDANGNLITRTDALNHETKFAYDARARLSSTTNVLGFATTFGYDPVGRLNIVTQADGTTIRYEYDLAGRRTALTDAKGNRSTFAYDGANRLVTQTDALNQSSSCDYDPMSNLVSTTDALHRVTNYEYDNFNRLVKTTYPPATVGGARLFASVSYDAGGNVTQRTDTAGRTTSYGYDDVNRVISTTEAASETTNFEYDALSRMTALVDAIGQRYRFHYDAIGQLRHTRRGLDVMSFAYDPVGNRKTRTDYNGAVTDYTYDALNRLKTISYPDATGVSYTYDKLSRLQTATNENGTVNFDYNKMNRVTTVTDVFGQIVDYNYDPNGNRTRLSVNSVTLETYRYDAIDRVTKILDAANAAFTFDYDSTSKLIEQKAPNAVRTTYQYDGLDRLTRITAARGISTIADFQYQFNNANSISQMVDSAGTHAYNYDFADRLTTATHSSSFSENYSYDSVGNRSASQFSSTYSYQRFNRLLSTATAAYVYDANGNLISKTDSTGTTQYSWDFENRLRQVTLPNGNVISYKFDPLGRRIERVANLVSPLPVYSTTRFVYDGGEVVRDLDGNGAKLADYLNGPGTDNKLRQTSATATLYFSQDHLGSTRVLTNSLGAAIAHINYDSFGNSGSNPLTRYGYTGREFDSDTGLYYYRARWYDSQVGRFISEDPIGLNGGGTNLYGYVHNNPINSYDPTGLYDIDVHYYLTYYLALHTGCFSDWESREIAEHDLKSDRDNDKAPGLGVTEAQRRRNVLFHAFGTPDENAARSAELLTQAFRNGGNLDALGTYLHFLQDSYSHHDFAGNTVIGQVPGGERVDHTNFDAKKASDMAHDTYDRLKSFGEMRGCKCDGDPDWRKVQQFIDVGWDQGSRSGRIADFWKEVSNEQLRRKIEILGVPWRSATGR
jgi:RHS repeat-associated protein